MIDVEMAAEKPSPALPMPHSLRGLPGLVNYVVLGDPSTPDDEFLENVTFGDYRRLDRGILYKHWSLTHYSLQTC